MWVSGMLGMNREIPKRDGDEEEALPLTRVS